MDRRAGHLTTTERTGGGAFANKKIPAGPGAGGGMLAAGIDSHIILASDWLYFSRHGINYSIKSRVYTFQILVTLTG